VPADLRENYAAWIRPLGSGGWRWEVRYEKDGTWPLIVDGEPASGSARTRLGARCAAWRSRRRDERMKRWYARA
jgi:hypothetical protein